MNIISNIKITVICCLTLALGAGCGDRYDSIESNNAYIKDAHSKKYAELYLEVSSDSRAVMPVNLTRKSETEDITVSVAIASEEMKAFNEKYNKSYIVYPADMWSFDQNSVVIKRGNGGTGLGLTIKPLTDELLNTGNIYVIPIKIENSDKAGVLKGADFFFYILRRTPKADVASSGSSQRIKFKMDHLGEKIVFNDLTIEFLFYMMGNYYPGNNQGLFYNNGKTETGGGQIFSRLEGGSSGLNSAALEWNIGDGLFVNAYPASGKFEMNKWYHVAMTFGKKEMKVYIDGVLSVSKAVDRTYITAFTGITNNPGWDGFVWDGAKNKTKFAELRLWNILRTQDQIQENMYRVNPNTEGLLGYWKINDGSGNTLKDYAAEEGVGGGYVHNASGDLIWYPDEVLSVGQ